MGGYLSVARLYFLLLAIFAVGRWMIGLHGVPYQQGTDKFSIITLTVLSCVYYGAFCRRWRGFRLLQAVGLGALLGLCSQVVILLATLLSYLLGLNTYFNHPTALQAKEAVPLMQAMIVRSGGLVGNTIFAGIAGALGWAMGALLPES